ncbi:hypothetical protein L2E82_51864 [Cichorium intybus]|nr:hypothetical protein L2E82_51864 [Cichorium intybus]
MKPLVFDGVLAAPMYQGLIEGLQSTDWLKHTLKMEKDNLPIEAAKGIVSGFCVLVLLGSIGIVFYRRAKRKGSRDLNQENLRHLVDPGILSAEDRKGIDVPFIEFKTILSATDNFSLANKLGQGGFGPVYKVNNLLLSAY